MGIGVRARGAEGAAAPQELGRHKFFGQSSQCSRAIQLADRELNPVFECFFLFIHEILLFPLYIYSLYIYNCLDLQAKHISGRGRSGPPDEKGPVRL